MSVITPFFNKNTDISLWPSPLRNLCARTHTHTHKIHTHNCGLYYFPLLDLQFQMDTANCPELTISKREMSSKKNEKGIAIKTHFLRL